MKLMDLVCEEKKGRNIVCGSRIGYSQRQGIQKHQETWGYGIPFPSATFWGPGTRHSTCYTVSAQPVLVLGVKWDESTSEWVGAHSDSDI